MNINYNLKVKEILDRNAFIKAFTQPETVYVTGEFNEAMATKFACDVRSAVATGQDVVPVVIDSFGGECYSLLHMIDTITSCPVPVATVVKGKAMSCGVVLLIAGANGLRFASQTSTVMLHEVAAGNWGKVGELNVTADHATSVNGYLLAFMDAQCKKPKGYFNKLIHQNGHADVFLTAKECIKHGIVNKIGYPSWEVIVSVDKIMVLK